MKKVLFPVLFLLLSLNAISQPFLQGKISDPRFTQGRISQPKSTEENLSALFTYASYYFSDMVYGRSFIYRPTHNDRRIRSSFEWSAQTELENPKKISVFDINRDEIFVTAWFRYDLTASERKRIETRTGGNRASASAAVTLFDNDSPLPMLDAYERACEEAVRNTAKKTIQKRKPKEIRGRLILEAIPLTGIRSGEYVLQGIFRIEFTGIDYFDYF